MTLYAPTRESLRQHTVPEWYHDAKLGIFVHWGPYSVPGWAPSSGERNQASARDGWRGWFAHNPYAEWYLNSTRIQGSPSYQHHMDTYGAGVAYESFAAQFNDAVEEWDPNQWAELFQQAGARYVVLTTKHHDGFLLWPSDHPNPHRPDYQAKRDLVGELTSAVRSCSMRMGLYYSGGLDWSFNETPVRDLVDLLATIPQDQEYLDYVDLHWRELITRYEPSLIWNDIGYPARADLNQLFAEYYNRIPDGVVNDRFMQLGLDRSVPRWVLGRPRLRPVVARLLEWAVSRMESLPTSTHHDFRTAEYASFRHTTSMKWEATRGMGYSFGYNRNEGEKDVISVPEMVHLLVDVVSKNGNLLLNVGPTANGTIPEIQRQRLLGLGSWLDANGQAIFGTRPWLRPEGTADDEIPVRFTQRGDQLFAILLGRPSHRRVMIKDLHVAEGSSVHLLGIEARLEWQREGENLAVTLPEPLMDAPAYALRIALPERQDNL